MSATPLHLPSRSQPRSHPLTWRRYFSRSVASSCLPCFTILSISWIRPIRRWYGGRLLPPPDPLPNFSLDRTTRDAKKFPRSREGKIRRRPAERGPWGLLLLLPLPAEPGSEQPLVCLAPILEHSPPFLALSPGLQEDILGSRPEREANGRSSSRSAERTERTASPSISRQQSRWEGWTDGWTPSLALHAGRAAYQPGCSRPSTLSLKNLPPTRLLAPGATSGKLLHIRTERRMGVAGVGRRSARAGRRGNRSPSRSEPPTANEPGRLPPPFSSATIRLELQLGWASHNPFLAGRASACLACLLPACLPARARPSGDPPRSACRRGRKRTAAAAASWFAREHVTSVSLSTCRARVVSGAKGGEKHSPAGRRGRERDRPAEQVPGSASCRQRAKCLLAARRSPSPKSTVWNSRCTLCLSNSPPEANFPPGGSDRQGRRVGLEQRRLLSSPALRFFF